MSRRKSLLGTVSVPVDTDVDVDLDDVLDDLTPTEQRNLHDTIRERLALADVITPILVELVRMHDDVHTGLMISCSERPCSAFSSAQVQQIQEDARENGGVAHV